MKPAGVTLGRSAHAMGMEMGAHGLALRPHGATQVAPRRATLPAGSGVLPELRLSLYFPSFDFVAATVPLSHEAFQPTAIPMMSSKHAHGLARMQNSPLPNAIWCLAYLRTVKGSRYTYLPSLSGPAKGNGIRKHSCMARSFWKEAIASGVANIPGGLTSAEDQTEDRSLHLVDKENNATPASATRR